MVRACVIVAVLLATPPALEAQRSSRAEHERAEAIAGWDELGSRTLRAHGNGNVEAIEVPPGLGTYRRLRLRVDRPPLYVEAIAIVFVDGSTFLPGMSFTFSEGEESHDLVLPDDRAVRRVEIRYGDLPADQTTRIELWAS